MAAAYYGVTVQVVQAGASWFLLDVTLPQPDNGNGDVILTALSQGLKVKTILTFGHQCFCSTPPPSRQHKGTSKYVYAPSVTVGLYDLRLPTASFNSFSPSTIQLYFSEDVKSSSSEDPISSAAFEVEVEVVPGSGLSQRTPALTKSEVIVSTINQRTVRIVVDAVLSFRGQIRVSQW